MQIIFRIASGLVAAYLVLILLRILFTWFTGYELGKAGRILASVTDPYLRVFRRIRVLSTDRMDFTPVLASIVLVVLLNIFSVLALSGKITLGLVLALLLQALWSTVSFILLFFIILLAARFVMYLMRVSFVSPLVQTLDLILSPLLAFVQKRVFRKRIVHYKIGIAFTGAVLIILSL
jgi:YggT family protein